MGSKEEHSFKDHLQNGKIQQSEETFKEYRSKECLLFATIQLKEALELKVEEVLPTTSISRDGWLEVTSFKWGT